MNTLKRRNAGERKGLWRSRWAAVGAAVAVTLGAGGLATINADSPESVTVLKTPARVLDTRINLGLNGAFSHQEFRTLDVTGTIPVQLANGTIGSDLVVPDGATGLIANVTAVNPSAGGFISVVPGSQTAIPTTSNLNFSAGQNTPNSVNVEIPTTGAGAGTVKIYFFGAPGASVNVLLDIVGYNVEGSGGGGQGPKGDKGDQGDPGAQGPAAWDTIPSGQTVTGTLVLDVHRDNAAEEWGQNITLPGVAPAAPSLGFGSDIFPSTDGADPECAGTPAAPNPDPGWLCVYAYDMVGFNTGAVELEAPANLPEQGAVLLARGGAAGDSAVSFTWAYEAP